MKAVLFFVGTSGNAYLICFISVPENSPDEIILRIWVVNTKVNF